MHTPFRLPWEHIDTVLLDMDGTLLSSNVVETYLWSRLPEQSLIERAGTLSQVALRLPLLLSAERKDRGVFLRQFYRRYEGANLAALEQFVDERMAPFILDRTSPEAIRRIREHRDAGHTTVLLTGVIRPLTRPFEGLFDRIVAADLATDDNGICTGFLTGPPMVGESRSAWLHHFAALHQIDIGRIIDQSHDLARAHAFGQHR